MAIWKIAKKTHRKKKGLLISKEIGAKETYLGFVDCTVTEAMIDLSAYLKNFDIVVTPEMTCQYRTTTAIA